MRKDSVVESHLTNADENCFGIEEICCGLLIYYGYTGLILRLRPANERRRYFVTTSLIGWAHTKNQRCYSLVSSWLILSKELTIDIP